VLLSSAGVQSDNNGKLIVVDRSQVRIWLSLRVRPRFAVICLQAKSHDRGLLGSKLSSLLSSLLSAWPLYLDHAAQQIAGTSWDQL